MHPEAFAWVKRHSTEGLVAVLDIGGRDINGSPRSLFPNAVTYRVLDIADGENVNIVADAATWVPDREYDVVVCTEVFEHTPVWRQICATAYKATKPAGRFIATMAGPGRPAHSAVDGGPRLHPGEHYGNIDPNVLHVALKECGWQDIVVEQAGLDVRAVAAKP